MSIFEQASRKKLRFETSMGLLTAEDLWDLALKDHRRANLNDIAVGLHKSIEAASISFVDDEKPADTDLRIKFNIVKHIIDAKKAEMKTALEAHAKAERKQKLLGVLARKEDAALESLTPEEIKALIDAT